MTYKERDHTDIRREAWHGRYHDAQADATQDTAAKRAARAADLKTVRCPCGVDFPSAVKVEHAA